MAPILSRLRNNPGVESLVCVTAQHREMLDQVLGLFEIQPDFDLDLMRPNQSLAELTGAILKELEPVLAKTKPDWILVQGDTTTVMAAALLSYYHHIRVGHVEAGLRTGDKWQPFPEELNRRIAGVVADLHFAPTVQARNNLLQEGVRPESVLVTGNPVIDALKTIAERPYDPAGGPLAEIPWERRLILVTAHRRENFGRPLENICQALREIAGTIENVQVVYPVHPNPNVLEPVKRLLGEVPNISLLDPLDYLPFIYLMKRSTMVITDSGGLQEEAPGLGKPVLVMRAVTERPEGVQAGTVRLVGTAVERIVAETRLLLEDRRAYEAMAKAVNPYGDGRAAVRIVDALLAAG